MFLICSAYPRQGMQTLIREFRLSPPSRGQGISCDADGVFVGIVPLLKRSGANGKNAWQPIDNKQPSERIGSQIGLPIDMSRKMGGLKTIANALNAGDIARAQIATVLLGIPDPPPLSRSSRSADEMIKFIRDLHWSGMIKGDWDPDEHPRWPAGAPDSQGGRFAPKTDSDACGINETARRRWMRHYGEDWPRDATGRRYDVHHIKARADGGTDDPENIRPMPHDEHVREHKERGDFSRWSKEWWAKQREQMRAKAKSEAAPNPELETRPQPTRSGSRKPEQPSEPVPNARPAGTTKPETSPERSTSRAPKGAPNELRGAAPRFPPEATPEGAPEATPGPTSEEPIIPEEIIPEGIPIIIPE